MYIKLSQVRSIIFINKAKRGEYCEVSSTNYVYNKSNNLSNTVAVELWFASSQVWLL